jgi:hypothetical protein
MDIVEILNDAGYSTVIGADAVLKAIASEAGNSTEILCSGYGVFPNGDKCPGCKDCYK